MRNLSAATGILFLTASVFSTSAFSEKCGTVHECAQKAVEIAETSNVTISGMREEISKLKADLAAQKKAFDALKKIPNKVVGEITSHDGYWGKWHKTAMCPSGQYVCGMRVRIEDQQGDGDDTAMNSVRLQCCSF